MRRGAIIASALLLACNGTPPPPKPIDAPVRAPDASAAPPASALAPAKEAPKVETKIEAGRRVCFWRLPDFREQGVWLAAGRGELPSEQLTWRQFRAEENRIAHDKARGRVDDAGLDVTIGDTHIVTTAQVTTGVWRGHVTTSEGGGKELAAGCFAIPELPKSAMWCVDPSVEDKQWFTFLLTKKDAGYELAMHFVFREIGERTDTDRGSKKEPGPTGWSMNAGKLHLHVSGSQLHERGLLSAMGGTDIHGVHKIDLRCLEGALLHESPPR
jgi:hypothetical protein